MQTENSSFQLHTPTYRSPQSLPQQDNHSQKKVLLTSASTIALLSLLTLPKIIFIYFPVTVLSSIQILLYYFYSLTKPSNNVPLVH